ncbi:DUF5906 domain-containing protein [Oleiharenicola lentus]|uniref:DUF5906 domain-containing protein n=1 Tax=Oleiharenicola lentus TaxID=2508720 RepID=UPI003F6756DD
MPDPEDAFESKDGMPAYYFDSMSRLFWMKNEAGEWVDLNETQFKRELKKTHGLSDKPNVKAGEAISPLDEKLREVEQNSRVAYAGLLAGYRAGMHMITGRRVLVMEDPVFIEPKEGAWPVLEKFFTGLLVGEEPTDDNGGKSTIDQRPWFFAWLQHGVQSYMDCQRTNGLALGIAGEPDCGKSFLTWVLRQIFGGRVGKPYAAMTGQDNFNKDAAEAVLQLVDDENQADTKLDQRQKFASEIKKFVANNEFRLRAMHKDGFSVEVLRRLVVLVNLQGILVLPPLDGDVDDKIMLLKGYTRPRPSKQITTETPLEEACWPSPMPTRTEAEKESYRATVRAELPAFLWWLLRIFKMPSHVSGGRFIVRHWHHPAIKAELHEMSPHTRLWDLIVRSKVVFNEYVEGDAEHSAYWKERDKWEGSAGDLEVLLKNHDKSKLSADEKREVKASNWLGKRLALCEKHFGEGVCHLTPARMKKTWTLTPRPQDKTGL